ncbi:LLM class flavin-dependent oxidoreductase [Catenuloplanes atrovinosus]|uniref:F420-dependent oxidoreductase-like protein n=1 Tax=Catenuloplanes atrovinosus TaxID=137266 RepID=A0AAE3YL32_9ACTN|nr:LLM class flavin-dependent oxidoreductase [Catenuloplanes atrovinosus]MDR7275450.1 F420-dependent oxidoreductase-like protein [Catenuloplanes atrovinosus]
MRIGTGLLVTDSPADVVAAAADAARRGLDSFWTNQMAGGWDPLTLLALLRERPAEVGTAIALTYPRHPVTMATEALTLRAAGGGLALGVGPGHAWYVERQLKMSYQSPLGHTRDYLETLRPLLHGARAGDAALDITAPAPDLLLAALGPKMLGLARELADGVVATWVTPEIVAERLVPSQPDGARIVVSLVVALTTDPDTVRERIARDFAGAGALPAYRTSLRRAGLGGVADTVVVGDEAAVVRALDRLRDAGATDVVLLPVGERARTLDIVTRTATPRAGGAT